MHRSFNISQTLTDETLASQKPVQSWLPHSQNQNPNQLKLNQNNLCIKSKTKSIPIIDPQTRMEIVVNGPRNLDQASDSYGVKNKSNGHATADTLGISNLRAQETNPSLMDVEASQNVDLSSHPRPFECSTPAGGVKDGLDTISRMSQVSLISGRPSHQVSLMSGRPSDQVSLMSGKPSHKESLMSGRPSHQVSLMSSKHSRKPSHQESLTSDKTSQQVNLTPSNSTGDGKEVSDIPRRMSQVSLMLGKPLSQPRGLAGSVCTSFSRRSCRSRTGDKERRVLLGKLNSRLAGLEEEGKQVIVGLEMLEIKVKALIEEAKLTAEELDCEGDAMDKYTAKSQYLVQVEDQITLISAALNQWQDFSSDSEEVDDHEVSNVEEVTNDGNMAKEDLLGGNEENCGIVNNENVEVLNSIAEMINIGNKAKDEILEDKVENCGLKNKQNEKESIEIADTDTKDNTAILEGNMENGSQVNKQMETIESQSNSSDGNFISLADLINGKEMLNINKSINTNEKNTISCLSPTQIRKLQNVNSQISAELKQKLKALQIYKTEKIKEDRGLINLDSYVQFCNGISNNICSLTNPNETVDDEKMADLVEVMPEPKNEKDEEDELEHVSEQRSDSLGSTWEDDNTKSKLQALSSLETKSKVHEWLNSKWEKVNTSSPQTSSVKSFRAKLRPKKDIESKNMIVDSDMLTDEVVKLGPLKIVEDENCSFLFKLSAIENPGKFFIHPVQDEMACLTQIHNEIKNHPRIYPDKRLVLPDTVWSMFNRGKQGWCRVRVESRSSTCASVRYIDFGTSEERVELSLLRHLPNTWVRHLPGLALQCNLGWCSPVGRDWDDESTAALHKILGDDKEHRAVTVGESNGSLHLLLLRKGKIVNQQMVEGGFASTEMMDYFTQFRNILGLYEI